MHANRSRVFKGEYPDRRDSGLVSSSRRRRVVPIQLDELSLGACPVLRDCGFGISMGYHRLHTHRGFKTYKPSSTSWLSVGRSPWKADQFSGSPRIGFIINIPISRRIRTRHGSAASGARRLVLFGDSNHNDTERMGRYAPNLAKNRTING